MKIDVVDELHKVRSKHAHTLSDEIEKVAAKALMEIQRRRKK